MRKFGLLVISHGSRNEKWVRLVDEAVAGVKLPIGMPVESCFLEIVEGRLIQDGLDRLTILGVTDIITVPLFVSSGSTHIDEISYALGVIPTPTLPTELRPFDCKARIHLCSPIDDDPDIAQILYERVLELSTCPSEELVLLIGHGSAEKNFHIRWRNGLEKLAHRVKELGGFAEAEAAMLLPDQVKPAMERWKARRPDLTVLVAPLFVSEGYFTNEVIPSRLEGYVYRYNGKSLLPHPKLSSWMERQVAQELAKLNF